MSTAGLLVPVLSFAVMASVVASAPAIQGLGDLPGGSGDRFQSNAWAISDDGSTVVGYSYSGTGPAPFRWSKATGIVSLGTLGPAAVYTGAYAVSADGSVVVGESGGIAFRWTAATGIRSLGSLPSSGSRGYATDVSGDGEVVVGFSSDARRAFRWTAATGMVSLGTLPGMTASKRQRHLRRRPGGRGPERIGELLECLPVDCGNRHLEKHLLGVAQSISKQDLHCK